MDSNISTNASVSGDERPKADDGRVERAVPRGDPRAAAWMTAMILCVWMLMYSAFSPPEDFKVRLSGTKAILPPAVLSLIKLGTRVGSIALLACTALRLWRHPQRDAILQRLWPLILFACYGIASVVWSGDRRISLQQGISFGILVALAYGVAMLWRSDADSRRLLTHLSASLCALASLLLIVHFAMPSVGALTRNSSGVLHSTGASAASGLGILLIMGLRLLWNSKYSRCWPLILAIHVGVLLVAGNRLSIAVTGVALVGLLVYCCHRAWLAAGVLGLSLLGTTYLVVDPRMHGIEFAADSLGMFAKQGQSKRELSSLSGRQEMWTKMWHSYRQAPLMGHGYFVTSPHARIYVWHEWGNWTAHNFWLQVMTTTGAIGLSLLIGGFLWIGLGIGLGLVRGYKRVTEAWRSIAMLATISLWYFGWGILNSSFIGPLAPESVVFGVMLGIAAAIATSGCARVPKPSGDSKVAHGASHPTCGWAP